MVTCMTLPTFPSPMWFLICDGERIALLERPQQEDMFWWSYEVSGLPEVVADVFSTAFWEDVFEVEDARSGVRIPGVFAGQVRPTAPRQRVWLRGFIPHPSEDQ